MSDESKILQKFVECKKAIEADKDDGTCIIDYFQNEKPHYHHTKYFHYTRENAAENILSGRAIWFSQLGGANCNDITENDFYKKNKSNVFSLCLCTGTSESLPLWYLYSGIDGKGIRFDFTKKLVEQIMEINSADLLVKKGKEKENAFERVKTLLRKDNDFEIYIGDILYCGIDKARSGFYRMKYNGKTINEASAHVYENVKSKYEEFMKGLIWFYEKETRIQIKVNCQLEANKEYKVAVSLENIMGRIGITLAPEYDEAETENLLQKDGFKNWSPKQIKRSDYSEKINMGLADKLCKSCQIKKIVEENQQKEAKQNET